MFKRISVLVSCAAAVAVALIISLSPQDSQARVGGGGSLGSRGSRSYSRPAAPPSQSSPYQQATPQPAPRPYSPPPYQAPQPAGGGFFRSMAGGIAGGLLGGMLFRSLGSGGMGGGGWGGGGGIGIFEILLIGGVLFLIYRFIKSRREAAQPDQNLYSMNDYREPAPYQAAAQPVVSDQPRSADRTC